jgi:amino acid transporter
MYVNVLSLANLSFSLQRLQKTDKSGRPWYGLIPTLIIGGGLSYLNVNNSGATVFGWFSNLTSLFTLFGWGMICLSHIRMRHAWKIQGRPKDDLPWQSGTYPVTAWWGLSWCIILIVVQFYLAVWPLHAATTAKGFFSVYVSVPAIVVLFIGAKIYFRGRRWVNLDLVNLDENRRFYAEQQMLAAKEGKGFLGFLKGL